LSVWKKALLAEEDPGSVFDRLHCVFSNARQAVDLATKLNIPNKKKENLTSWYVAFEKASAAVVLNQNWQTTLSHFTPDRKVHLEYCSLELDAAIPEENQTSKEDLAEIIRKIESLISGINNDTSLDIDFKFFANDLLEAARLAFAEYRVRGNQGVINSFGYILSSLMKYKNQFDTPEKKRWAKEIREIVSIVADISTITGYTALTLSPLISGFLNSN